MHDTSRIQLIQRFYQRSLNIKEYSQLIRDIEHQKSKYCFDYSSIETITPAITDLFIGLFQMNP